MCSNFYCSICNTAIYEGYDGNYITGCPHYPLSSPKEKDELPKEIEDLFGGIFKKPNQIIK